MIFKKPINTINLNLAGFYIKIDFYPRRRYKYDCPHMNKLDYLIIKYFQNYILHKKAVRIDHHILIYKKYIVTSHLNKEDIDSYQLKFFTSSNKHTITYQHISINQFMYIMQRILQKLLTDFEGSIIHASSVLIDKKAYLFTGSSGAGKSTIMRKLKNYYLPLSDDLIIIRKENKIYYCYQYPFPEKYPKIVKNSNRYILGPILFLRKSTIIGLSHIEDKQKIIFKLSKQILHPNENRNIQYTYLMELISSMNNFYLLRFNIKGKELYHFFSQQQQVCAAPVPQQ